jgi:hypothetical protein
MIENWVINHLGLRETPKNTGSQWISPAIMAKTAPMDKT